MPHPVCQRPRPLQDVQAMAAADRRQIEIGVDTFDRAHDIHAQAVDDELAVLLSQHELRFCNFLWRSAQFDCGACRKSP